MCVENISSKDVYVFFILRRRVQRYCTAVRDGKNKKYIHRLHIPLCVHNKIYLPETVHCLCGTAHRVAPFTVVCVVHAKSRLRGCKDIQPQTRHLKITDLNPLAHLPQTLRQFLDKVHLYVKINRKLRVLMRRIDRPADIEIYVGSLLKQQPRYL